MKKTPAATNKATDRPKGLYQKNGVWWLGRQRNKKRVLVSLETKDYAEAVVRAQEIEEKPEMNPGGLLEAEIDRFCKDRVKMGVWTHQTERNSRLALGLLVHHYGNVTPESVTPNRAQDWYDTMHAAGVKEVTAQTYLSKARAFFQWLVKQQIMRANPFTAVKTGRLVNAARKEFCRKPLRDQLLANVPKDQPELKFILYCGFHAGMRRNEIVEARPCWFDLPHKVITIRKLSPQDATAQGLDPFDLKDREERSIPISKEFGAFLKEWLAVEFFEPAGRDYCIAPGVRRGKWRYRYDFVRPFTIYTKSQSARWVTAHTMRRTFASLHATAGTPLYHIAKWLGDDLTTTQKHYAHLAPDTGIFEKGIK